MTPEFFALQHGIQALWALVAAVETLVIVEALRFVNSLVMTVLGLIDQRKRKATAASMAHEIVVAAEPYINAAIDARIKQAAPGAVEHAIREGRIRHFGARS
jgi:hypothetical protein